MISKLEENYARQQLASEAADLGFWSNDLVTGDITFDERWVAVLGYRPNEVQYKACWYEGLIHPDDRGSVELAWRRHLSGQTDSFEVEHRLRAQNGGWRLILSKGRVIARDSAGTPLRAAGTHLDVTATRELERQAEQALRDRNRELQLVTDAIPVMIGYVDRDEQIRFVNRACTKAFEMRADEFQGLQLVELFGAKTHAILRPLITAALKGERVQAEEDVCFFGANYWWLLHLLPRVDESGTVQGFYMLITDVTGVKESEEEVERQREALALHNRRGVANEMAAAIAHEINQPLATISIYASELLRSLRKGINEPDEIDRGLTLIDFEAQRAGQITRRVRELVENRKPKTSFVDLKKLVLSARQICEVRARSGRVRIDVQVDAGADGVEADELQLQQVLVNLINNAIDASLGLPDNRRQVTVHISSSPNETRIIVKDCGHGLDAREVQDIFTPYYTTKPDGLGIGLNICRSIVAAHGGKLWVTPNESFGATFHVLLPRVVAVDLPETKVSVLSS